MGKDMCYKVKWLENGETKSESFDDVDDAFLFQSGLLARFKDEMPKDAPREEADSWTKRVLGVWTEIKG